MTIMTQSDTLLRDFVAMQRGQWSYLDAKLRFVQASGHKLIGPSGKLKKNATLSSAFIRRSRIPTGEPRRRISGDLRLITMERVMAKKWLLVLGLLPFILVSVAFGQAVPNPSTDTAPKAADTAPKAAPLARLVGGVEIVNLKDAQDMSLPYNRYPGLQFRTSKEFFTQYPDRSKVPSGLYLMDTELIPPQLPQILARTDLAPGPNGTIVNNKGEW